MSERAEGSLNQFQLDVAAVFFQLPESAGFLLAGGGALIAQGLVQRETDDLDFFAQRGGGDVTTASDALATAANDRGWTTEELRSGREFRRLRIIRSVDDGHGSGSVEVVYVDLALDSPPTTAPTVTIAGPSLAPRELAIRKTLALFSRAEPRDFTDVYTLNQQFDRDEILDAAAAADPGFDAGVFAQMLRSHRRLSDQDFPQTSVSVADLRTYFEAWADQLLGGQETRTRPHS